MSDLPPGFVIDSAPTAPAASAGLPDGFVIDNAPKAPAPVAAQPKSDSYFGLIPMAKGIYKSTISGLTLPGDVYAGRAQIPSSGAVPGSVPFGDVNSAGTRVADLAGLISPINPAARAGDFAIPGAREIVGAPRYETMGAGKALETELTTPVSYAPNLRRVTEAPAVPTIEELNAAASKGFEDAKNMGVEVAPTAMRDLGNQLEQNLQNKGILAEHAPTTYATIERLKNPPPDAVVTVSDLHNLRQAFGNAAGNISHPKDTLAGSMGKEALDSYLSAIPAEDVLAGDAAAASATLKDAIGNSAAAFRAEDIGARLTRAERQAAKSGSGSNIDNAIRQKISAILDVKGRARGYSPEEVAQMEQVVRGTTGGNIARKVGKLGVSDGLSLLLHSIAAGASGGASLPVAAIGTGARKVAEAITQRGANRLDEMIRARSPLAESTSPIMRELTGAEQAKRAMIARIIASQAASQRQ